MPPLGSHEATCLFTAPGSLRLIKNYDLLVWRIIRPKRIVPEMVNILNEAHNFSMGIFLSNDFAGSLITSERFLKNHNKRAIAGQKHSVFVLMFLRTNGCDVKAGKRLSCSWDACDEANRMAMMLFRSLYQAANAIRRLF